VQAAVSDQDRPELVAAARVITGAARARQGDLGSLPALQGGVELLEGLGRTAEAAACCAIQAHTLWFAGRLDQLSAAVTMGQRLARAANGAGRHHLAWLNGLAAADQYRAGRWDQALQLAEEILAGGADDPGAAFCRRVRAAIRLARGDLDGATSDAVAAQTSIGHPDFRPVDYQLATALLGRIALARGDHRQATGYAQLIGRLQSRSPCLVVAAPEVAFLLAEVRTIAGVNVEAQLEGTTPTGWLPAVQATIAGEYRLAASRYAELGTRPEEAESRWLAAHHLARQGQRRRAGSALSRAITCWRSVDPAAAEHRGRLKVTARRLWSTEAWTSAERAQFSFFRARSTEAEQLATAVLQAVLTGGRDPQTLTLLDYGSSDQQLAAILRRRFARYVGVAIDSPEASRRALQRLARPSQRIGPDVVLLSHVLAYVGDPVATLQQLAALAQPTALGIAILCAPEGGQHGITQVMRAVHPGYPRRHNHAQAFTDLLDRHNVTYQTFTVTSVAAVSDRADLGRLVAFFTGVDHADALTRVVDAVWPDPAPTYQVTTVHRVLAWPLRSSGLLSDAGTIPPPATSSS
jgi:hypothetical protein